MHRRFAAVLLTQALLLAPMESSAQLATPNDAGVTWGHIHLNVTDLEAHTRIWTEHFGGRVVDFDLVHTISLPNTIIMLNEREPTAGTRGSSLDHFGFSVPDVDAFLERWRAAGLDVESEFQGFSDRPQAYLTLPDGIRVELEQVPSLDVPAVPYHVHIYTDDDPEALRNWFAERFSMTHRERGFNPFTADVPGMNVSFSPSEQSLAPPRGRAVDHIGFEIDDLEAFTRSLAKQGVEFGTEYRTLDGLDVGLAFFTDASGTLWELTEELADLAAQASAPRE